MGLAVNKNMKEAAACSRHVMSAKKMSIASVNMDLRFS